MSAALRMMHQRAAGVRAPKKAAKRRAEVPVAQQQEFRTGQAPARTNDEICISENQKKLHVTTEALAVFVAAPFTAWLALKPRDTIEPWERTGLAVLTVGTLLVDGGLLLKWATTKKKK